MRIEIPVKHRVIRSPESRGYYRVQYRFLGFWFTSKNLLDVDITFDTLQEAVDFVDRTPSPPSIVVWER